jgi:putative flavoprotein involved in K+ transport
MERRLGRWVSRADFIDYVERYAAAIEADIRFGVEVTRLDREDAGWLVTTSEGPPIYAHSVIVAGGLNTRAHIPPWPGMDAYRGRLLHAADYREPAPFRGSDVLVVGLGASATDIALELARHGAGRVRISVRSAPLIFRRHLSTAAMSQAIKYTPLPDALVDRLSLLLHDLLWGDLSAYGLARPREGLASSLRSRGHGATMDRGLVAALKQGRIGVVAAVERFHSDGVQLADGTLLAPDAVIAATGQRPDLQRPIGHLGVLSGPGGRPAVHGASTSANAPGLYFIGYRLPAGQLPDMNIDARAIARRVVSTISDSTRSVERSPASTCR